MGRSPLPAEFLAEDSSIDSHEITVLLRDDASTGWLLNSPYTAVFSKMHLPYYHHSPYAHGRLSPTGVERRTKACQLTSRKLQNRLSISSESSDPGMMDDPFASSGSDTSLKDKHEFSSSVLDLTVMEEDIWNEYWTPVKDSSSLHTPLFYVDPSSGSPLRFQDAKWSPSSYAPSSPSPEFTVPRGRENFHLSSTIRKVQSDCPTPDISLQTLPRTTYSPFPTSPQTFLHPPNPSHLSHQVWPMRVDSHSAGPHCTVRSRAHTTPSESRSKTRSTPCPNTQSFVPSPLSPLYGHSAPPSPGVPTVPFMDLMSNSVSVFDDDDDGKSPFQILKGKLHIRSGSAPHTTTIENGSLGRKKKTPRKSISAMGDALKGVFGKKRSPTITS